MHNKILDIMLSFILAMCTFLCVGIYYRIVYGLTPIADHSFVYFVIGVHMSVIYIVLRRLNLWNNKS